MNCCVCVDPETSDNRIIQCESCGIFIHMLCYGVKKFSESWKCSPCTSEVTPTCVLCTTSDREAFKHTTGGKWVHVICALFTEGVTFSNTNRMEPVNIKKAVKTNKVCDFCSKKTGYPSNCSQENCTKAMHIMCAKLNRCLREAVCKIDVNKIVFKAYCGDHKPILHTKRLSSEFVRDKVNEKSQVLNDIDESSEDEEGSRGTAENATISGLHNLSITNSDEGQITPVQRRNENLSLVLFSNLSSSQRYDWDNFGFEENLIEKVSFQENLRYLLSKSPNFSMYFLQKPQNYTVN